jgi:hypothetical protein
MTTFDSKLLMEIQETIQLGYVAGRTEAIHGTWRKEPTATELALQDARGLLSEILPSDVDNRGLMELFLPSHAGPSGSDLPVSRVRALHVLDLLAVIGEAPEYLGKEMDIDRRNRTLDWAKQAGLPDNDPRMLRRIDLAVVAEAHFLEPDARVERLQEHISTNHPLKGSFATSLARLSLASAMRERGSDADYEAGAEIICQEHEFRKKRYGATHPLTLVSVQHFLWHLVAFVERSTIPAPGDVSPEAQLYRTRVGHLKDASIGRIRLKPGIAGLEEPPSALDLVASLRKVRADVFGEHSRPVTAALGLRARIHFALGEMHEADLIGRATIDAAKGFTGTNPDVYRARSRVIIAAAAERAPQSGDYEFTNRDLEVLRKQHETHWLRLALELKLPAVAAPARAARWLGRR